MKGKLVLQSERGNPVFYMGGTLQEEQGGSFQDVDKARVVKGDYTARLNELVGDMVAASSLPTDAAWSIDRGYLHIPTDYGYNHSGWYRANRKRSPSYTTVQGVKQPISVAKYDAMSEESSRIGDRVRKLDWTNEIVELRGEVFEAAIIASLIGVDNWVTSDSFREARAKDEEEPRVWIGDRVKFIGKGKKEYNGTVLSLRIGSAYVDCTDGKKRTAAYYKLTLTTDMTSGPRVTVDDVDERLKGPFDKAIESLQTYRAKLVRMDIDEPFMSGENVRKGIWAASCPTCGSPLAESHGYGSESGEFCCVTCKQFAMMMQRKGDEATFVILPPPAKNQFCMGEARCCGSCGLFHFEYGRQGKRSTGYCRKMNYCVQGYNVCENWFPRSVKRFRANLRQHTTNLGYGVADSRNTSRGRQNIEDNVYTEEDHEEQKQRASDAIEQYSRLDVWFRAEMIKKAEVESVAPPIF